MPIPLDYPAPAPAARPSRLGRFSLVWGVLSFLLPPLCVLGIWLASPDADTGFLAFAASVAVGSLPAIAAGATGVVRAGRQLPDRPRRWQAWTGLALGLASLLLYAGGGFAFGLMIARVLRHD